MKSHVRLCVSIRSPSPSKTCDTLLPNKGITMRYTQNQEVWALFLEHPQRPDSLLWFCRYYPWLQEHPPVIHLKKLTMAEHHKVPYAHDPEGEKVCDGFIFHDEDGVVWHNQYPYAEYGQTCDAADGSLTNTALFSELAKTKREPTNADFGDGYDLFRYVRELKRGLYQRNRLDAKLDAEQDKKQTQQLQQHLDDLIAKFREVSGKDTHFTQKVVEGTILEGWFDISVVEVADDATSTAG